MVVGRAKFKSQVALVVVWCAVGEVSWWWVGGLVALVAVVGPVSHAMFGSGTRLLINPQKSSRLRA